ncbi:UDP-N-acetylmuramoyl-L-alanine--D-glutamate ligase [Propionivibrio sp.]|uniref:UDP-N-acetylmuramoyl-L-alanine--D-glutamate ligase n=1 Tax=Propionivibrio sp. TaxID=2212460 RepID=UPI002630A6D8|nr:UDP-N-acetylmuramoyl-L-alanine--D-glutamate ligase [Propionivibrio sp.]
MNLQGKQVLVIGLGESGLAMAKWLVRQGASVRVADSRVSPPNAEALRAAVPQAELIAGPFAAQTFAGIELIAISPGVAVQEAQVQTAVARGVPLVSEIELFAWGVRALTPQAKIIAITGSNGKTTTTALTGALCLAAGRRAVVAGNIGPAALDALMAAIDGDALPEIWVLELSSFQLETTHSLHADAATVLNVSEDHLDRYTGMDDYAATKARIFKGHGVMVLNRDDDRSLASGHCGRTLVSFGLGPAPRPVDYGLADGALMRGEEKLIALTELQLPGRHNAANAMAALALCEAVGIAPRAVLPALASFKGLAHRVELVAKINGVAYYDDSKGTNVGATLAAVQGMGCQVAIILGGEGKEQDFTPLKPALTKHARAVALIGRDAGLIAAAIEGCGAPLRRCADLSEAVRWCAGEAKNGDAVLLSPACASYDMFRNYLHRADMFIDLVRTLQSEAA